MGMYEAINEGVKMTIGLGESIYAWDQLGKLERPQYETSDSAKQLIAQTKANYGDQYSPSVAYATDAANITGASGFANITDPSQVATIQANQNKAFTQIGMMKEKQNMAQYENYKNAMIYAAQQSDAEWQLNKFAEYKDKHQMMMDMAVGGMQTASDASSALAGLGDSWQASANENRRQKVDDDALKAAKDEYNPDGNSGGKKKSETGASDGLSFIDGGMMSGMGGFYGMG